MLDVIRLGDAVKRGGVPLQDAAKLLRAGYSIQREGIWEKIEVLRDGATRVRLGFANPVTGGVGYTFGIGGSIAQARQRANKNRLDTITFGSASNALKWRVRDWQTRNMMDNHIERLALGLAA